MAPRLRDKISQICTRQAHWESLDQFFPKDVDIKGAYKVDKNKPSKYINLGVAHSALQCSGFLLSHFKSYINFDALILTSTISISILRVPSYL